MGAGEGGRGVCRRRALRNAWGVYRPALRSVTRGWGGVKFSGKKRYVTLERPF